MDKYTKFAFEHYWIQKVERDCPNRIAWQSTVNALRRKFGSALPQSAEYYASEGEANYFDE